MVTLTNIKTLFYFRTVNNVTGASYFELFNNSEINYHKIKL